MTTKTNNAPVHTGQRTVSPTSGEDITRAPIRESMQSQIAYEKIVDEANRLRETNSRIKAWEIEMERTREANRSHNAPARKGVLLMTPHNDATPYWYKPDGTLRRDLYTPEELEIMEEDDKVWEAEEAEKRRELDALHTRLEESDDVDICIGLMDDILDYEMEIGAAGSRVSWTPYPEPGFLKTNGGE